MKQFGVAAVLIMSGAAMASAQSELVSSHSESAVVEKTSSSTRWIVRAGANVMSVAGESSEGLDARAGYDISVAFERQISNGHFFWGMDLGFTSRGFSDGADYFGNKRVKSKISMMSNGIRLSPVTFGYGCGLGGDWRLSLRVGAFMSVDYSATMSVSVGNQSANFNIDEMKKKMGFELQRFDAGMFCGIGVSYRHVSLDITPRFGFVNIFKDYDMAASNTAITLGYAF